MPRYHLSLVCPHRAYGPPPDLSRPELRAAFDAGRASRGDDDLGGDIDRWHELRKQGRPVMQAYWAGRRKDVRAPIPLPIALAQIGVFAGAFDFVRRGPGVRERAVAALVLAATGAAMVWTIRAPRSEGLTAETAPTIATPASMLIQAHIDAVYVLWSWRRDGVRMRSAPLGAAAAVTRTLMHRRSWRAALDRT